MKSSLRIFTIAFMLAAGAAPNGIGQSNAEDELAKAQRLHDRGDFAGAIAGWSVWLKKHPRDCEILLKRASSRNYKGDFPGVIADYNRVIELNPKRPINLPAIYQGRAEAKFKIRDFTGAINDYTRVIKYGYMKADAYYRRGIAQYLQKNWTKASADFEATGRQEQEPVFLEVVDWAMDCGALMNFVVQTRLGKGEKARKELNAWLEKRDDFERGKWAAQLASFLLGTTDEVTLLKTAESDDWRERMRPCQAWYFAGMKRIANDDWAGAAECFRKSIATEQKDFPEYEFATAELGWLGEK